MPKPKKVKTPAHYDSLPDYLGALFADSTRREKYERDKWAQQIARAIIRATGNAPEHPVTKEATVKTLEAAQCLLAIAREVADEGRRRCALMGYPDKPA